jgi:hypothetical protein
MTNAVIWSLLLHMIIAIDRGFQPRLGKTKVYSIGFYCFSHKHEVLIDKSKDWLSRNQGWNPRSIALEARTSDYTIEEVVEIEVRLT